MENIKDVDFVASIYRCYGADVLATLLKDRTTGKNIIWADREYQELGSGYAPDGEMTIEKILDGHIIEPRIKDAIACKLGGVWRDTADVDTRTAGQFE